METLILLILITGNPGGTNFTELSKNMVIVELGRVQKVLGDAKESSQKAMDKSDIQKMLEKAKEVLNGATVFCSSEVIN